MSVRIGCAALYPFTRYGFPYQFDEHLAAVAELSRAGFDACELEITVDIDVIPKPRRRLMHVDLPDNDGSYPYHLPAGRGNMTFPAVFRSLQSVGFHRFANVDCGGVSPAPILAKVRMGREYFSACLASL